MFADLMKRLFEPPRENDPMPPEDCRLALAALMVRLGKTDGTYSDNEQARIEQVLMDRYGLDRAAAEALRREAEAAEAGAPDTVRFTRVVKSAVPYEDRAKAVEALWRVALADGIHQDENAYMRLVSNLLGVSDVDSGLARQSAVRR